MRALFFDRSLHLRTDYPDPVGRQSLELEVTPDRYAREIAFARTFGWEKDLDQMRNMGLIRGASLENAICFGASGALNPGARRIPPRRSGRRQAVGGSS